MTVKEALAQRDDLRAQARRANEAAARARGRREEIDAALDRAAKQRKAALQAQARTGDAADLDRLDREQATLARDRGRALEAIAAAGEARHAAGAELARLHRDHAALFMEHAEKLAATAHERLAQLRPLFDEARAAWIAARREWNTIGQDLGMPPCPPCPLPAAVDVFHVACRTPGVEPVSRSRYEPAVIGEPRDAPAAPVMFEHTTRTGLTQAAVTGTPLYRALEASPDWQIVDEQQAAA